MPKNTKNLKYLSFRERTTRFVKAVRKAYSKYYFV